MKTARARLIPFFILFTLAFVFASPSDVRADAPVCTWYPDPPPGGHFECSGGGGGGGEPPPGGGGGCTPGTTIWRVYYAPNPEGEPDLCYRVEEMVDACTGQVVSTAWYPDDSMPCQPPESVNPCEEFTIGGGGITCDSGFGYDWTIEAAVGFPVTYLDVRPFPATLVRWPTAARNSGQTTGVGTGTLDYAGNGGGSEDDPEEGDWRNLVFTISLQPIGPMQLTLPNIGTLVLLPTSDTSAPTLFQWEVPSHPAAGGSVLAGDVTGLDELPADIPAFVGRAGSPYLLFWSLTYEEYVSHDETYCEFGPSDEGVYECRTDPSYAYNNGHWDEYPVYEWEDRSQSGIIYPWQVADLPEGIAVDLNNDGTPDAYWNSNVTIRRMDDNDRVTGHEWERSWNWGGLIYWAVREGQGQIGWPGVP